MIRALPILFCALVGFESIGFSQDIIYVNSPYALYQFDFENDTTTFVGSFGSFEAITDIAMTPNGKLYGVTFYDFYEIDTSDGSIQWIAQHGQYLQPAFNNLYAINDTFLLGFHLSAGYERLFKIRTDDGTITPILNSLDIMDFPSGDITRINDWFYFSSSYANNLCRFRLSDDYSSVTDSEVIGSMNTPGSSVYGILTMGTADCAHNDIKLYAFENWSVYEVNTQTANCTLVSDTIFNDVVFGATSRSESAIQDYELVVQHANIFTPDGDGVNDVFEPVILSGVEYCSYQIINRWGEVVKENAGTDFFWDGTNKNNEFVSSGVYYYVLNCTTFCSTPISNQGTIYLVR